MAAILLDPSPGDTVIVPSFAYVTTALSFARAGFRIVFADIEPTTLGVDPAHVAELIDERVRAVVAVHYAGVACDLQGLQSVLDQHDDVELIEDNAHGLFGNHRTRPLGSFGRCSALSFHETKNITCGEGGALVLNREADVDRARIVLDKGTNRHQMMTGQAERYSWQDTGSSFGLADLNAAFLLAQLEERETILSQRKRLHYSYVQRLDPIAEELGLTLPTVREEGESGYHLFYVLVSDAEQRPRILANMRGRGIHATFHYVPLHSSEGGRRYSERSTECPVTDDVSSRLVRLPFYNSLTESEVDRVVDGLEASLSE